MLTSLLFIASIWGADPKIVFVDDHIPWTQPLAQSQDSPVPLTTSPIPSTNAEGMFSDAYVARGQTVADDPSYSSNGLGSSTLWDDPILKRLIDELNPFAPLYYQILPNFYDPYGLQNGNGKFWSAGLSLGMEYIQREFDSSHSSSARYQRKHEILGVEYERKIFPK